jgi:type I restriction enzyme M protein
LTRFLKRLGLNSKIPADIQKLIDTIVKPYESFEKYFKISAKINAYIEAIQEKYKAFSAHGDSLTKPEQKNYALSLDPVIQNWPRLKKTVAAEMETFISGLQEIVTLITDVRWLYDKFGEGTYADISGLCRLADIKDIEEKNWSLTPGAYVGVADQEDDGVDFAERMKEIHVELQDLQKEANTLSKEIFKNYEEMGL